MTDPSKQSWNIPLWAGEAQNVDRIVRKTDRIICVSSGIHWSYCIVFKMPKAVRSCITELTIQFDVDIVSGSIGIGAIQDDGSTFIDETVCAAGEKPGSLTIAEEKVPNLAMLVIRNATPGGASAEFVFKSITAVGR
jgi:hypothetical protein